MKVEILNGNILENLYRNHGEFACECYATPQKYAKSVGKKCEKDGHMSGSRCEYIKFRVQADRGTLEQMMRSEIGVRYSPNEKWSYTELIDTEGRVSPDEIVKNMQSFRYVDKAGFSYVIPKTIQNNEKAMNIYTECMNNIQKAKTELYDILIESDVDSHKATEDSNFVLPRATETSLTIGFTPEALIRFMWKRLCVRAQDEIREVAKAMKAEVEKYNPEFAKELIPHCQHLLWCPEGDKGCGAFATREQVEKVLKGVSKKDGQ